MKVENLLKNKIEELTDFDTKKIHSETPIQDIGLDSLDFLSIQVSLQKELNINLNINLLAEARLDTYGEFLAFITSQENKETS